MAADEVFDEFDQPAVPFPGSWDTDSRFCLVATAPKPAEVLAAILTIDTHERV